jgi:hypothetical protein
VNGVCLELYADGIACGLLEGAGLS